MKGSASLVTALLALAFSVASLILSSTVFNLSGPMSNEMMLLEAEQRVAGAIQCRSDMDAKNDTFLACVEEGNRQCSNLTEEITQTLAQLATQTEQSLAERQESIRASCSARVEHLKALILQVTPNDNAPEMTGNGTFSVTLQGALPFTADYQTFRFSVGGFNFDYLILLPWSSPHVTAVNNPTITYSGGGGLGTAVGERFLLNKQQEAFAGGNVVSYRVNRPEIVFRGVGVGTFQQIKRFMIF